MVEEEAKSGTAFTATLASTDDGISASDVASAHDRIGSRFVVSVGETDEGALELQGGSLLAGKLHEVGRAGDEDDDFFSSYFFGGGSSSGGGGGGEEKKPPQFNRSSSGELGGALSASAKASSSSETQKVRNEAPSPREPKTSKPSRTPKKYPKDTKMRCVVSQDKIAKEIQRWRITRSSSAVTRRYHR